MGSNRRKRYLKDFAQAVPQRFLNIEDKSRSNIFTWRGQFSPQLIEVLLDAYCLPDSVVLDPFAGSGTVLLEAATKGLSAFGYEINPSAWAFCKLYEFSNIVPKDREGPLSELRHEIQKEFPIILFREAEIPPEQVEERIIRIAQVVSDKAKIVCNALVVLLDIYNNHITGDLVQARLTALSKLIRQLPYSKALIKADLQDARGLPLDNQAVDFVITSPPYINVFNYHQNYRRSVELLGWDLLRVARSEIGSNRANRGNRFLTVVQYCIDMANALQEIARVLKPNGRAVLIVGYESRVLGTPFYNAAMVNSIANEIDMFTTVLHQKRVFTNRFGKVIREDVLNLSRSAYANGNGIAEVVGRRVAMEALQRSLAETPESN